MGNAKIEFHEWVFLGGILAIALAGISALSVTIAEQWISAILLGALGFILLIASFAIEWLLKRGRKPVD